MLKLKMIKILALAVILIISNRLTLNFYFWHDDFSSFYGPQVNQCIHGWPYYSFCSIFDWLVKFFGYTPFPYFLIGNILSFCSVIAFYIFVSKLLNNSKVAFYLSGLLASSYIGAGIFLEAWDPLVSYSTLSTLLLSLIVYLAAIKNEFNAQLFILATIIFLISISLFNFRSATSFVPVIALIFIYASKIQLKKKFVLVFLTLFLFFLVFYFIPVKVIRLPLDSFSPEINLSSYFNLNKLKYFFQTISAFFLLDFFQTKLVGLISSQKIEIIKTSVGFVLSIGFIIHTFLHKKDKGMTKLRIFSLIWVVFMFLPFWLRNDFSLNTTHRYILWMYPGVLLAWATFYKYRYWIPVTLIFLVINIVAVNFFYQDFLNKSVLRELFYRQLHTLLPEVKEGSVLYFDFQPKMRSQANDYFRVGFTPPQSAIGTEYRVDYNKITLLTKSEDLEKLLSKPDLNLVSLHSFYYADGKLADTTNISRSTITSLKLKQKVSIDYLDNGTTHFKLNGYQSVLPTTLEFQITTTQLPFNLPYEVKCPQCSPLDTSSGELQRIFKFLEIQSDIDNLVVSTSGENTHSKYIIDNFDATYWIGDRSLWYKDNKPYLDFPLNYGSSIDGLVIYSKSSRHIPIDFLIEVDSIKKDFSAKRWTNGTKIEFDSKIKGNNLKITILKTDGGDVPVINELRLLPAGFKDINLEKSDRVRESSASFLVTKANYQSFVNFLSSGVNACLEYQSKSYDNGHLKFKLYADGILHSYTVKLPSLGIENPEFSIGCLPYPIKVTVNQNVTLQIP